ncbi:peptide-methionine (S)-S-oxide reductase MsrA [Acuticoccus sp.]|uniref:peptide-methionine (S)-S-oxide reductase MsrA n=1 Tax=Acuticoccus sp. TaxID=1904378 RepID=UPI003B51B88F
MNMVSRATAAVAVLALLSPAATSAQDASGAAADGTATAVFAGGCFWCVEADFDKVDGVLKTVSGYTGGTTQSPTYKEVTYGDTGHYEAVEVTYDPAKVDYRTLVDYHFRHIDPTDAGGQFCDRGDSYRTAIFVDGAEERAAAEASKAEADALIEEEVVTPIFEAGAFYPAEEYHQDYYEKSSLKYKYYRWSCGRDARVAEVWAGVDQPS